MNWHVYEVVTLDCLWDSRRLSFDGWKTGYTWEPEHDVLLRDWMNNYMILAETKEEAQQMLLRGDVRLPWFLEREE